MLSPKKKLLKRCEHKYISSSSSERCSPPKRRIIDTPATKSENPVNIIKTKRIPWSEEEKLYLLRYVEDHGGIDDVNWVECASSVNQKFGNQRHGKSCQSQFKRVSLLSPAEVKVLTNSMSTQTEIAIGPRDAFAWGKIQSQSRAGEESKKCEASLPAPMKPPSLRSLLEVGRTTSDSPVEAVGVPLTASTSVKTIESERDGTNAAPATSISTQSTSSDHGYCRFGKPAEKSVGKPQTTEKVNVDSASSDTSAKSSHSHQQPNEQLGLGDSVRLKMLLGTRDLTSITETFMSIPSVREKCVDFLAKKAGQIPNNLKTSEFSCLSRKGWNALVNGDIKQIVEEFKIKFPDLVKILVSVMLPADMRDNPEYQAEIVPHLGLIYFCLLKATVPDMSGFERILLTCLADM